MTSENKLVFLAVLAMLCVTSLIGSCIYVAHKNALAKADVQKHRADEGIKFKFGITKEKQAGQ